MGNKSVVKRKSYITMLVFISTIIILFLIVNMNENSSKIKVKGGEGYGMFDKATRIEIIFNDNEYIVSNPPYIRKDMIPTLMEEVRDHEPLIALDGGEDGLDFYRKITREATEHLYSGGMLFFEIGYDQGEAVSGLLKEAGFKNVTVIKDLAHNDRVVTGMEDICLIN